MPRSPFNLQSDSGQSQSHHHSEAPPEFSNHLPLPPVLTSYEAGWNCASLEFYSQPAGETPKLCLDHYAIAIYLGQGFQLEQQIEGVARGRLQKDTYSNGGTTLIPMHYFYWGRWQQPIEAMMLNLQSDLLLRNAAEVLAVEQVELLPRTVLYDPLILQIALALKADLESQKPGGRLYAEAMATALTVHILRNYSAHSHQSVRYSYRQDY
jgi:AraC family transcriptional regulator